MDFQEELAKAKRRKVHEDRVAANCIKCVPEQKCWYHAMHPSGDPSSEKKPYQPPSGKVIVSRGKNKPTRQLSST